MSLTDFKSAYGKTLKFIHPGVWLILSLVVAFEIGYFFLYANRQIFLFGHIISLLLFLIAVNWTANVTAAARGYENNKAWKIYHGITQRYSDLFILGGFMISPLTNIFWGYFALISCIIAKFTGLYGKTINIEVKQYRRYAILLLITLITLVQYIGFKCGHIYMIFDLEHARVYSWLDLGAILVIILAQITIFGRILEMRKAVKEKDSTQW